ncbi:MAG TPA: sulfurtransferase [Gemmatimonadales bacterium]|jgi:Rhodanese-related sulfurtransferase
MSPLLFAGLALAAANPAPAQSGAPLVVTTAWLAQHLADRDLVLFHIGDQTSKPVYDEGHIPGAQFLNPFQELSTPRVEGALFLELPTAEFLDSVLEARGISDHSRIVLYSARQYFTPTSRTLFTLEYAGLAGRVSILDGGLEVWKSEGRAVSTEVPAPARGRLSARANPAIVADADFVRASLESSKVRLVDARDTSFYNGRETRQGRNGHIKGAVSIPFTTMVDSSGKFRSPAVLQAQFAAAGVQPGQTVVTYCHIGQQASLVWFMARVLGYDAKMYDGSFQDWAARPELPVVNPAAKPE